MSSAGSSTICSSKVKRVGRDGYLLLELDRRRERTEFARCRFRLPLQVSKPCYLENDGTAFVLLLNPAGGLVGGDDLQTEVVLRKEARACLSTPSATAVYRSLGPPAHHRTEIHLEEGAVLEYFPEHLIPYANSSIRQSVHVQMAPRSTLILNESFAAGRIARGERWQFNEMTSETEVTLAGTPAYISRSKIVPAELRPQALGLAEECNYIGSLAVISDRFSEWGGLHSMLRGALDAVPEVEGGASLLGRSGCVARTMARTAAQLTSVTHYLWHRAREAVMGKPLFACRKY